MSQAGGLTLLSGPAGFGKTTLLSEAVVGFQPPVAWVSLDEADNDPARFWTYLIAAWQAATPGVGEAVLALFRSPQPLPAETIPTILINDLAGLDRGLVLVVDDYHVIQNNTIHEACSFLVEHLPANLSVVLSTRVDPPWPLARFRARNKLTELRTADLRFTTGETAAFLTRAMGLNLSPDEVAALEARTEGWIAGLQLAAIAMQSPISMHERDDPASFVKDFAGSHVFVAEYLVEEVLRRQSESVQAFLLQTSILERLNAGLCEAVTGCKDGQAMLTGLQRANLFVLPLDDEGRWYRYHHLFADLLQARLRQAVPPEAVRDLHSRAAAWYEANDFAVEAVNHALAGKDFETAARLVEQNTYSLTTRGELATLLGWIAALPAEVSCRPNFLMAKAWALLFAGAADQIEMLVQQIETQAALDPQAPEAATLLGTVAAIRAFFALMVGDHGRALELARRAESLLPPAGSEPSGLRPYLLAARSVLPYTLGMGYRGQGLYEKAAEAFEQEVQASTAPSDILIWTIATVEVAVVRRLQGRLRESAEVSRRALRRIAEQGAHAFGSLAKVEATLAEILREQNGLAEAWQRTTGAIDRMRAWNMPTDRLAAYLTLGRIQLSQRDLPGARETVRVAKELRAAHPVFLDLSRTLDMLEIRVALAAKDIGTAAGLMEVLQPGTSQIVFLRDQELVLLAQLRIAQDRPGDAIAITSPLASEAELAGRLYTWLTAQLQQALALDAQSNRKAALAALRKVLPWAEAEGFVGVFMDEGKEMQELLSAIASDASVKQQVYLAALLEAFPAGAKPDAAPHPAANMAEALIEQLTARELEVLQLIASGASNQTIADRLTITVSAVKKHTGNIFGKLGVKSRTQAVARARQLKLLPL